MIEMAKTYLALCWTGWIAFLVWLIGGFDLLASVLLALMFLDFLTGLWVGYRQKNLNSKRAYKGFQKKFLIFYKFHQKIFNFSLVVRSFSYA